LPYLVWRFAAPLTVASTAGCGGGLGERNWVLNVQVAHDYARHDLDQHGAELAALDALPGSGVVMFTAANVRAAQHAEHGGVRASATVGLTHPTWAADGADAVVAAQPPGTINVVAVLPVRLSPAALLNALTTVTEAKSHALLVAGVAGTGTPSDAVTVCCASEGPVEPFAGPRSVWGSRLAQAAYDAILAGARG
jgi:adenosylcobinamide amidohydrolase